MEDIHEKIPFMEKLIFTLNEENAKQVMVRLERKYSST